MCQKVEDNLPEFSGKYYYTLDPKGRIIVPAPFREILSSNYSPRLIFVNDAFDRCLRAYPIDEWNSHMEKVKKLPQSLEEVKFYMRRVVASAVECEIDKQGRTLIPSSLREDAGLNGDVVLAGQIDRIEVWDRKEWDGVADPSKIDRKTYAERLASLGL
ncbi:MAG: division/cell wall cluster transcriptional repressor MraZ [Nitrospirae bacterium]|nr:division/cell wall cluster transcriptional repressor MraZ [Nitrospirota bacterium]